MKGKEGFPKPARLRKRPEFLHVSRTGFKVQCASFVVISQRHSGTETRLGITVSSKVGNSVVRNRIKRMVREFFRRRRSTFSPGLDILVIARKSAVQLSSHDVVNELGHALAAQRGRRRS